MAEVDRGGGGGGGVSVLLGPELRYTFERSKNTQTLLAPLLRAGYLKHRVTDSFSTSSKHPHSKGHTETHI